MNMVQKPADEISRAMSSCRLGGICHTTKTKKNHGAVPSEVEQQTLSADHKDSWYLERRRSREPSACNRLG